MLKKSQFPTIQTNVVLNRSLFNNYKHFLLRIALHKMLALNSVTLSCNLIFLPSPLPHSNQYFNHCQHSHVN